MNKVMIYTLLVLAGVVFASKIRSLPLGDKIPSL